MVLCMFSYFCRQEFYFESTNQKLYILFLVFAIGTPAPAQLLQQAGGEVKETQDINDGAFLRDNDELPRRR